MRVRSQVHGPEAFGTPSQSQPVAQRAAFGSAVVVEVVVVSQLQLCVVLVVLLDVVVQLTLGAAMPSTHEVRVHTPSSQPHHVG